MRRQARAWSGAPRAKPRFARRAQLGIGIAELEDAQVAALLYESAAAAPAGVAPGGAGAGAAAAAGAAPGGDPAINPVGTAGPGAGSTAYGHGADRDDALAAEKEAARREKAEQKAAAEAAAAEAMATAATEAAELAAFNAPLTPEKQAQVDAAPLAEQAELELQIRNSRRKALGKRKRDPSAGW